MIIVRSKHRQKILEECSLSLIGQFLTTKPINLQVAKNLLRSVWKFGQHLKITDVGGANSVQVHFGTWEVNFYGL